MYYWEHVEKPSERDMSFMINLSDSPLAKDTKEAIELSDVDEAEKKAAEILRLIEDEELRGRVDQVMGIIAGAYEKLGFCTGYTVHKNGA